MNCEQIQPKLFLLVDGELPVNDLVQVETHLASCQQCKNFYDQLLLESQSLSAALAVSKLKDLEIHRLEKRVMQLLTPPLHVVIIERLAAFTNQLFLIVLILFSCSIMLLLQFDTLAIYEKIVQDSMRANELSNLARNIGVAVLLTIIVMFWSRVGWLFTKITKGGFRLC